MASILLAVVVAGPALRWAGLGNVAASNSDAVAAAHKFLLDPLLYLNQRSPGARGSGALLQTKNRVAPVGRNPVKPHERVLANVRSAPPGLTPQFLNDLVPIDFAPVGIAPAPIPINPGSPPAPGVPVIPFTNNPGGGGGGGGVKPPGAVPEPATWFMLILGMVVVGSGLRGMHRRNAQGAAFANAANPRDHRA